MKNQSKNAMKFVSLIREMVVQELDKKDSTVVSIVESVNEDGTLNLYIPPDEGHIIKNIINQCRFDFNPGDTALLYLINNRLSNSFVIAKYNAQSRDVGWNK